MPFGAHRGGLWPARSVVTLRGVVFQRFVVFNLITLLMVVCDTGHRAEDRVE